MSSLPAIKEENVNKEEKSVNVEVKRLQSKRQDGHLPADYEEEFMKILEGVVGTDGFLCDNDIKNLFKKCGLQSSSDEDVLLEELRYNKNNKIHWTELLDYMSTNGITNWLNVDQVDLMEESFFNLLSKSGRKKGEITLEELETAIMSYLPDHVNSKEDICSMLAHIPPEHIKDGKLQFRSWLDQMIIDNDSEEGDCEI